jgi:hypothetical protein
VNCAVSAAQFSRRGTATGNPLSYTDPTGRAGKLPPGNDLDVQTCIAKGCPVTTVCPSDKLLNNTCYLVSCNFGPLRFPRLVALGECYYRCRDGATPFKNMTRWGPGPTIGCFLKPECSGN